MQRVKIEVPAKFTFSTSLPIRITDLNYGNHAGNQVFFEMMHEARVQFLARSGYSEPDFGGVGLIMGDAAIEYKVELYYGDIVNVQIAVAGISRVGFDLIYVFEVSRGDKLSIAARAKTGMIAFNYSAKKVAALPEEAIRKIQC